MVYHTRIYSSYSSAVLGQDTHSSYSTGPRHLGGFGCDYSTAEKNQRGAYSTTERDRRPQYQTKNLIPVDTNYMTTKYSWYSHFQNAIHTIPPDSIPARA